MKQTLEKRYLKTQIAKVKHGHSLPLTAQALSLPPLNFYRKLREYVISPLSSNRLMAPIGIQSTEDPSYAMSYRPTL